MGMPQPVGFLHSLTTFLTLDRNKPPSHFLFALTFFLPHSPPYSDKDLKTQGAAVKIPAPTSSLGGSTRSWSGLKLPKTS